VILHLGVFKLYDVVKYVSMTNHMWSGFSLLAHLPTWTRLPDDVKRIIDRNVAKYVRLQRADQERANARMRAEFTARGLVFNDVDRRRSAERSQVCTRRGKSVSGRSAGRSCKRRSKTPIARDGLQAVPPPSLS
jgi:TRAP-type C4-dicarboxylate transport system substrate-binding protein